MSDYSLPNKSGWYLVYGPLTRWEYQVIRVDVQHGRPVFTMTDTMREEIAKRAVLDHDFLGMWIPVGSDKPAHEPAEQPSRGEE